MIILCALCPLCSQPPKFMLSELQLFCGNDDCSVINWNGTQSLDENLMNAQMHNLPDWLTPPNQGS